MPTDIPITSSDTIALSEAVAIGWGVPRSVSDSLSLSDSTQLIAGLPLNAPSDQLMLTDSIQVELDVNLVESGLVTISVPQVIGALGANVSVNVTLNVVGNARPVAVQFRLVYSIDNLTLLSATLGAAGTAAGKILAQGGTPGADTFLIYGLNQNAIATGTIVVLNFNIPSAALFNPTQLLIVGLAVATATGQTINGNTPTTVLFSDSLVLADFTNVLLDMRLNISDSLNLSDVISVSGSGILNITRIAADTLMLSDAIQFLAFNDFINYIRRYLNDVIPN